MVGYGIPWVHARSHTVGSYVSIEETGSGGDEERRVERRIMYENTRYENTTRKSVTFYAN